MKRDDQGSGGIELAVGFAAFIITAAVIQALIFGWYLDQEGVTSIPKSTELFVGWIVPLGVGFAVTKLFGDSE